MSVTSNGTLSRGGRPLKRLAESPRGKPLDVSDLRELGISSALAGYYVSAGWLRRLGRGIFARPGDELTLEGCLGVLARHIPGLHVGGKTALAWHGVVHNVAAVEVLVLWGDESTKLPNWFTQRFPNVRYVCRKLFDHELPLGFGIGEAPRVQSIFPTSSPERALLELLSGVGMEEGVEEARNIMEGLRNVRSDALGTLLRHCWRSKVVRLAMLWSRELGLAWAGHVPELAGGEWSHLYPDGTRLRLKLPPLKP